MQTTRFRRRACLALAGALLLTSQTAQANHATFTFNATPDDPGVYADITSTIGFGADEASTMEIQVPTGWLIAQQTGTSPITPIPDDEEVIGSGTATALWLHTFCDRNRDLALTVTWEATIDSGAPSGTVGQATVTATNIFNTQVYIVRNGSGLDYDLEIPTMPGAACDSTTNGSVTLLIDGETADGDKVAQNPGSAGNYTATMVYTDRNSGTHTTSTTESIS